MMPAIAPRPGPIKKTRLTARLTRMPSRLDVVQLSEAARIQMPSRVPLTNSVSPTISTMAATRMPTCTVVIMPPSAAIGSLATMAGKCSGCGPTVTRTALCSTMDMPSALSIGASRP